jgi:hypothetical protein
MHIPCDIYLSLLLGLGADDHPLGHCSEQGGVGATARLPCFRFGRMPRRRLAGIGIARWMCQGLALISKKVLWRYT